MQEATNSPSNFSKRPFWVFLFVVLAPALAVFFAAIYQGVQGELEDQRAHQEQMKEIYQTRLSSYQREFRALSESDLTSSLARALHYKGVDPRTNTTLSQWQIRFEKKAQSFRKHQKNLHAIALYSPEKNFVFDTSESAAMPSIQNTQEADASKSWLLKLAKEASNRPREKFISFSGGEPESALTHFVYPIEDQEKTFEGSKGILVFSLKTKSLLGLDSSTIESQLSQSWLINQNVEPIASQDKKEWRGVPKSEHEKTSWALNSKTVESMKASLREINRFKRSQILSQGGEYALISAPIYPHAEDLSKSWYVLKRVSLASLVTKAFVERAWVLWIFFAFLMSCVFMLVTTYDERVRPLEAALQDEQTKVASLVQLKSQLKENLSHHRLISSRLAEHLREFRQGFDEQGENFFSMKDLKNHDHDEFTRLKDMVQILKEGVRNMTDLDELSFQARVISFNASIEASKAGESAQGLRVVAKELEDFHQRSQEALKGLKGTLSECFERAEKMSESKFSILEEEETLLRALDDLGNELQERLELITTESDESLFWHKRLFNDLIRRETRDLFSQESGKEPPGNGQSKPEELPASAETAEKVA